MKRSVAAALAAMALPLVLAGAGCDEDKAAKENGSGEKAAATTEKAEPAKADADAADAGQASDDAGEKADDSTAKPSGEDTKARKGAQDRSLFNRAAVRLNLPLYWTEDLNGNGIPDPEELAELMFYPTSGTYFGSDGKPTDELGPALARIDAWMAGPVFPQGLSAEELKRRQLVVDELDQGQAILVRSDLKALSKAEKEFVRKMLDVARGVDAIYAMQTGAISLAADLPADDPSSRSLFRRNWGPKCLAPKTEKEPACTALPSGKTLKPGLYPEAIQDKDAAFCKAIEKDPALAAPFVVVREGKDAGTLTAVPYTEAWPNRMKAVAASLRAAAGALKDAADEKPLRNYLEAAAKSFETNDWLPADEAWAAMTGRNSKWYVRVGPDEVYWEPCSLKAGIHLTLARINPEAIAWQDKLTPRRQEMENALAEMAGAPYEARQVSFQLPDFIDIVVNAGDDRDAMGATIGQSLPNWGPVANEGRGRTIAMSNLYTDPDSLKNRRDGASSLLTEETMTAYTDSANPGLLSTILHEAAHNMGPAHEYKVGGKVDNEVFGGPLASTAEELKAQTAALWFIEKLLKDGLITEKDAREDYVDAITWAFGHISRGMFDGSGRPKHYSQLAAIQVGFLMDEGALTFDPKAKAANGTDKGAFTIHFDKMPAAAAKLMKTVAGIKARGDRAAMEDLVKRYVTGKKVPQALITERLLRYPKASFVYSVDL